MSCIHMNAVLLERGLEHEEQIPRAPSREMQEWLVNPAEPLLDSTLWMSS